MQTPFHLTGKTILITGASSGIGRQAAIDCARMGATIILTGRNTERLKETYEQLTGAGHSMIPCDLSDEADIARLVNDSTQLDGVVHAAGIVKPFPIQYLTTQKINETIYANFYTVVQLTTALFKTKKINNGASLVFMSSISGQYPQKGNAMYGASKAALEAFTKAVAAEYAHKQIRANYISPAMVKTPMYDYSGAGAFAEVLEEHVQKYPLGVGQPEDIANAIIFLLSPASRWITGINLIMDGGLLLNH
jgi:NAD(P)-dependent dehydrogenase (short-subunit alcohol dehydrogenase family)